MLLRRVSVLLALALSTNAFLWPFNQKKFKANSLIEAGALGLGNIQGRVAAFGDFDGNQFLDLATLSEDQRTVTLHLWDHAAFTFTDGVSLQLPSKVYNIVPGDFTHDGRLDLLVVSQSITSKDELDMTIYIGTGTGFLPSPIQIPSSSLVQPIPLDASGNMKIDLLGYATTTSGKPSLKLWNNTWDPSNPSTSTMYSLVDPHFTNGQVCELANPHSNAILDFDGDCLADLFLLCKSGSTSQYSYQIWINDKSGAFVLGQQGQLPANIGPISFADMDRDGTMDMVFPTCNSISTSTGVGTDCLINIVYNKQKPLCTTTTSTSPHRNCRLPEDLCTSDPQFSFDFSSSAENQAFSRLPLASLVPSISDPGLLLYDTTFSPPIPLALKTGDADLDGFPEILTIVTTNRRGDYHNSIEGYDRIPVLLRSIPCSDNSATGCPAGKRTFEPLAKHTDPLLDVKDARGVSFLDMDEDGTLDIMVQRVGNQPGSDGRQVLFIQNNFFHDAFFLKAIVLNGACTGWCTPLNGDEPKYHPFGVSYSGGSYKYTVIDTNGHRAAAQAAQLPQTSYHALLTPYTFFGLGRTNNYIENLFVGSTKHSKEHFINMEGVIPNSKVVIMPSNQRNGGNDGAWKRELYLRPGKWIPWVTLTVVLATIILAVVVFVLHLNEKREDELERRRALHHINFDAL